MSVVRLKERPSYALMKQSDKGKYKYLQMPLWLFRDARYSKLSLEAKGLYTLLYSRYQLSKKNGWVNEDGEVYLVYPRKDLAEMLQIGEKRVAAAFRELAAHQLIWEQRNGLGKANHIYLACVEPQDEWCYDDNPDEQEEDRQIQNSENGGTRVADSDVQVPPDPPHSKKELKQAESNQKNEVNQSYSSAWIQDRQMAEESELNGILDACELSSFPPGTAKAFESAIERLYYTDKYRIGNVTLPQSRVRANLRLLDDTILQNAEGKLAANLDKDVKNSTAYIMATIFNCIAESESDLLVDPYLNKLRRI